MAFDGLWNVFFIVSKNQAPGAFILANTAYQCGASLFIYQKKIPFVLEISVQFRNLFINLAFLAEAFGRIRDSSSPQRFSRKVRQIKANRQQQVPTSQFQRQVAYSDPTNQQQQQQSPSYGQSQPPNCPSDGRQGGNNNMASSSAMSLNAAVFSQIAVLPTVIYCDNYGQEHSDLGRLANLLFLDQGNQENFQTSSFRNQFYFICPKKVSKKCFKLFRIDKRRY